MLGHSLWFSSLCLPFLFLILLDHLSAEGVLTSPTPSWGTWWERHIQKHKAIETQASCQYLQCQCHPTLSTNDPREAWIQWYAMWAQRFQQLGIGFLDFPRGVTVALTSLECPVGIPKEGISSYDQSVFLLDQRGREVLFITCSLTGPNYTLVIFLIHLQFIQNN